MTSIFEVIEENLLENIRSTNPTMIMIPHETSSKEDLFKYYFDQTGAKYMGRTWDSLDEVLIDTDWMKNDVVYIAHRLLPKLSNSDLTVYLKILRSAVEAHRKGPLKNISQPQRKIDFHVTFIYSNREEKEMLETNLDQL